MKNCISLWSWFAIPWWLIKLNISFYAYWPCFSTVFCSFFYWLVWTWFQFISNCLPGPSHYSQATGQIKYPTLEGFPNTSCLEITLAFVHAVCSPSLLCSSPSPKGLQLSTNVTWSLKTPLVLIKFVLYTKSISFMPLHYSKPHVYHIDVFPFPRSLLGK